MQRVDDGAHDGAVVPPRAADQLDAILQAPGGQNIEQGGEGAFCPQGLVGDSFRLHGVQQNAKRLEGGVGLTAGRGNLADGALEVGQGAFSRAIPIMGSPSPVQGEGRAEAFEGGHGFVGRQRVQLEGVRRPNRKGLQAQLGIFWLGTGVENARFIGGAPIVRVEEQPVDRCLGSSAKGGAVG